MGGRSISPPKGQRKIIGISLSSALASKAKAEANRRGIRLNELFGEIWALYEKSKPKEKP